MSTTIKAATRRRRPLPTAEKVAEHIIHLASQKVVGDSQEREGVTNLKLQKLLYFVQAYALGTRGTPVFSDRIEAWEYGPVVADIYHKYKSHKNRPIVETRDYETDLSEKDQELIERVWEHFGVYSAGRLVDITHAHEPWKSAYAKGNGSVISNEVLKSYYGQLLGR